MATPYTAPLLSPRPQSQPRHRPPITAVVKTEVSTRPRQPPDTSRGSWAVNAQRDGWLRNSSRNDVMFVDRPRLAPGRQEVKRCVFSHQHVRATLGCGQRIPMAPEAVDVETCLGVEVSSVVDCKHRVDGVYSHLMFPKHLSLSCLSSIPSSAEHEMS